MSADPTLPLISIITPSLNQASFLCQALRSVRDQHYAAHEHLVLDGGSLDGSAEILRSFQDEVPGNRLWWRSEADGGQSAALNTGFLQASGDIIGWLNADDRYRPECFEHVAHAFRQHPEMDILYGDYTFMDASGAHLSLRREIEFSHFILRYHRVLYIPTTATFFRRRVFDEGNLLRNDLHYAMDTEFFLRLADKGYRFRHLPRVLADFRIHPAGKSSQFMDRQQREHRSVLLEAMPLAHYVSSPRLRGLTASMLQLPAAGLRCFEKLRCGFYFTERGVSLFLQEQIRGAEQP